MFNTAGFGAVSFGFGSGSGFVGSDSKNPQLYDMLNVYDIMTQKFGDEPTGLEKFKNLYATDIEISVDDKGYAVFYITV
jgi:hypothetical protein